MTDTTTTMPETGEAGNPTPAPEDTRTFSQDDVNRIVSERLAKERAKAETSLAQREQELQRREFELTAHETLRQKGLPTELMEALNCSSPEAFSKSLELLDKQFNYSSPNKIIFPPVGGVPPGYGVDSAVREAFGLGLQR